MMKILHITNDYCGSKVHARLVSELDRLGMEQDVYTHFEDAARVGQNPIESDRVHIVYDPVLKKIHHYLFHLRVHEVYASMMRQVDPSRYDLVHASTLFSDGALAYRLHKKYGKPFVLAVRKTDVYRFLRLGPHTWPMGRKILLAASRIVFISPSLQKAFEQHPMVRELLPEIKTKFMLQPNGIDEYWLDVQPARKVGQCDKGKIIYVGKFDANKNVLRLIDAVAGLRDAVPGVHLDLVGGTGSLHEQVLAKVAQYPEMLQYHGQIFDRSALREIYARNSVFAMPSINETFGLVYIEAMTQGLSVLFTKGQGIDGLFDASVGAAVDAQSVDSIKEGLLGLIVSGMGCPPIDFEQFRWSVIASRYLQVFNEITAEL